MLIRRVWTTDKNRFIPALLSVVITVKIEKDPVKMYDEFTDNFANDSMTVLKKKATPAQQKLKKLTASQIKRKELPGVKIKKLLMTCELFSVL